MNFPTTLKAAISKHAKLIFVLALLLLAGLYNYHHLIFERPQSVHRWRQADCASLALNYYQNGMHFGQPETHNLTSDGGTTGKNYTSEIPILYYFVAVLYQLFGYHEVLFRLVNTLIFFLGLFYLFKLINYLLNDNFWAITLSLLFFTSPVLVYYGNNFLSNSSAFAFALIGWYFFIRFAKEKSFHLFLRSMFIFSIAGAFKLTAFFSLFAIAGLVFFELIGWLKLNGNEKLFKKPFRFIAAIFLAILPVFLWIIYAGWFNKLHDSSYFSTTLFPIWSLDQQGIRAVFDNLKKIWIPQYFGNTIYTFLGLCVLSFFVYLRKGKQVLNLALLFIFLEVVVYVLLQFWTFKDHDYYVIDAFILPVILVIATFAALKEAHPAWMNSYLVKFFAVILLLSNVVYARQQVHERYEGKMNQFAKNNHLYEITPYLRHIGISPSDTIIAIPDESHVSLYLMNQKGWTTYTDARLNRGEKIPYNQDGLGIEKSISHGAKYLIVNGKKELYLHPYLHAFCHSLKGQFHDVLIFDLKDSTNNFSLPPLKIKQQLRCDAEKTVNEHQNFAGLPETTWFGGGTTQNDEEAFSGAYSAKLNAASPYGFTLKLKDVKAGESFKISVWKKSSKKDTGALIVSANDAKLFYNGKANVVESRETGWEKLEKEFFIDQYLPNSELIIYAYNPSDEAVYFDDFELIRYESILDLK
ncbi:MAG: ArnT family glycosyltransferase [Prolixibacteraceae bacterium]